MKKPAELDITVHATLGLDMPTKMLALAVEVTEASLRECIMEFGWAVTAPIAWSCSARDRPITADRRVAADRNSNPTSSPGTPRSTSGLICLDREIWPCCKGLNT